MPIAGDNECVVDERGQAMGGERSSSVDSSAVVQRPSFRCAFRHHGRNDLRAREPESVGLGISAGMPTSPARGCETWYSVVVSSPFGGALLGSAGAG